MEYKSILSFLVPICILREGEYCYKEIVNKFWSGNISSSSEPLACLQTHDAGASSSLK